MLRVDSRCVRFAQHLRLFPKSDSLDVVDFNRDPKTNHFAITASAKINAVKYARPLVDWDVKLLTI